VNEQALARQIAAQVLQNTQFWIAIVGVLGAVVGGLLAVVGNLLLHWLTNQERRRLEGKRKRHLQRMLELKA
jgi:xanthine/uracil permease